MGDQDRPTIPAAWEQLELITSASADGITIQDRDGRLVYANDAAARMSGFPSAAAFLSAPIEEIVARFEMLDESGDPFPVEELPGRRALRGEPDPEAVVRFRTRPNGEDRWSLIRSTPVRGPDGDVQHAVNVFMDITDDRKRERVQRFLAEAGRELVRSLHWQGTLERVARLAVPDFADWCAVDILEPDGTLALITIAHVDPAKVRWAHELRERFPPDPDAPSGVWNAIRTGRSELIPEITEELIAAADITDPEIFDILERLRLSSIMYVPLIARGRTLGAIEMVWAESGKHYSVEDLEGCGGPRDAGRAGHRQRAPLSRTGRDRFVPAEEPAASQAPQGRGVPRRGALPSCQHRPGRRRFLRRLRDRRRLMGAGRRRRLRQGGAGRGPHGHGPALDPDGRARRAAAERGAQDLEPGDRSGGDRRAVLHRLLRAASARAPARAPHGMLRRPPTAGGRPIRRHVRVRRSAGQSDRSVPRRSICSTRWSTCLPVTRSCCTRMGSSTSDSTERCSARSVYSRPSGRRPGSQAGDVVANLDRELAAFDPGKANDDVAFVVLTMDPALAREPPGAGL